MSTTLPLFWKLSSASQKERIDASVQLVGALEQFQSQFVPKDSPETSEGDDDGGSKTDGLDALNAQDLSYSIRRLIRGLASPRESSRLGFAVVLTELLSRIETVTCSQIVSIILDSSKTQGSMTGQEERDMLFARLFGLTSVIQSGLLVRQRPLPASASTSVLTSDLAGYNETISQLVLLGEKKSWLRESAWWSISLALDALDASDASWKKEAVDTTIKGLFVDTGIWTPEKVALALILQASYPECDWRDHLSPAFKNSEILSTGNLTTLARILKESTLDEDKGPNGTKSALGNWKPQVHFVWDIILDQLLSNSKSTNLSPVSFQEFFRLVVDESLFSSTSSPERKYWGFQIFQKALPRVAASDIPMLFTKNFMRSWINHLSSHDRYLHKVAKQVATDIQSFVQKNPTLGFTLILQLTGTNGNRQFDRVTKTKTVESILTSMDVKGIEIYIDYLLKQVNNTPNERDHIQDINARRAWIIDQLGALIRNGSIPKNDRWIQSILDWLIVNGLFAIKKKSEYSPYRALHAAPTPTFSDDLRLSCRQRLLGCLADLTGQVANVKSNGDKTRKMTGTASDGEFWVLKALFTIEALEKDVKHVTLLEDVDKDSMTIRTSARHVADTLKQVPVDQGEAAKGAELLLLGSVLHQYIADGDGIDTDVLEACVNATTRMFASGSKKSKQSRKSDPTDADLIPESIDVLVDSIIGLLEQSTAYLRVVANQAFSLLSSAMQKTAVDLILMQLERRNPAELTANDEDMDDVEDDEDEEDSVDDEEQASSDEDDVEDDDDEGVQEVRCKIEEALRVNGIEAATENSDEGSDEDLMDDDQMMAIDEQLAQVFRLRVNEKKTSKDVDAQREATHFKNRVLDLVDIFIKKQPTSQDIIRVILPLVDVIAGTGSDERQLADKATGLLRNRLGKSKDLPSDIDSEEAMTVLDELHGRARRARSSEVLATLSQCSLYLSKVMLHSKAENSVLQVYRGSLVDFITRKASTLNATFFHDFIRRYPASGWSLRGDVIDASRQATNVYRRCQAFQLLHTIVNQIPALEDQQQEILTFVPRLNAALANFLTEACDEKLTLTAPQMKELFKLGLAAVRQTQRVVSSQDTLRTTWSPSVWDTLHKKIASSERFKTSTALPMCLQMVKLLQGTTGPRKSKIAKGETGESVITPKRKADVSGDDEGATTTRKAKRKKVKG